MIFTIIIIIIIIIFIIIIIIIIIFIIFIIIIIFILNFPRIPYQHEKTVSTSILRFYSLCRNSFKLLLNMDIFGLILIL